MTWFLLVEADGQVVQHLLYDGLHELGRHVHRQLPLCRHRAHLADHALHDGLHQPRVRRHQGGAARLPWGREKGRGLLVAWIVDIARLAMDSEQGHKK